MTFLLMSSFYCLFDRFPIEEYLNANKRTAVNETKMNDIMNA